MPNPVRLPGSAGLFPPGPGTNWLQLAEQAVNRLGEARSYEVQVVATGFTHTIPVGLGLCLLTPAGTLATGTLTMPSAASDGLELKILSTYAVTALTLNPGAGQTLVGPAVTSLAAGVVVVFRWVTSTASWYRMQ
jgi:hypothetical protein